MTPITTNSILLDENNYGFITSLIESENNKWCSLLLELFILSITYKHVYFKTSKTTQFRPCSANVMVESAASLFSSLKEVLKLHKQDYSYESKTAKHIKSIINLSCMLIISYANTTPLTPRAMVKPGVHALSRKSKSAAKIILLNPLKLRCYEKGK